MRLPILQGSHIPRISETMEGMRTTGPDEIPVLTGGIIAEEDTTRLRAMGVPSSERPRISN
ncbi:hypothetical protein [Paragemmobacter ruber]|uniref:Uncharacterized protein n=1 Tax=Paragemmobacter ruber TaxID=1985673 RepID=A0ABW9Y5G0_9RHOB|nr:hypothetical protein [Rhodobacter ruber]NBE07798.1 hypothetical protein [Rhodobacter ruber]